MFDQLRNCIFSILILLIFKSPSIYGATCSSYQRTCYNFPTPWCCPSYATCGISIGSCRAVTMPIIPTRPPHFFTIPNFFTPPNFYKPTLAYSTSSSSNLSSNGTIAIFIVPVFVLIVCFAACARSKQQQRVRSPVVTTNNQRLVRQHPQQPIRGPIRVAHVQPVYTSRAAASSPPPISSIYEESLPTYEVAIANPPPYQLESPPPPVTATVHLTDSQV